MGRALLDLKGRRLASNMETEAPESDSRPDVRKAWERSSRKIWGRFYKVWNSKNLPVHPAPLDQFVPCKSSERIGLTEFWPIGD